MQLHVVLARYRLVRVDVGAIPHLLPGLGHVDPALLPVERLNGSRREEYVSIAQPVTRVDLEVPDEPLTVFNVNVVQK